VERVENQTTYWPLVFGTTLLLCAALMKTAKVIGRVNDDFAISGGSVF
jgi:hypothetical protein